MKNISKVKLVNLFKIQTGKYSFNKNKEYFSQFPLNNKEINLLQKDNLMKVHKNRSILTIEGENSHKLIQPLLTNNIDNLDTKNENKMDNSLSSLLLNVKGNPYI
jgi:hypothetical protein